MSSGKAHVGIALFMAVAAIGAFLAFGAPLPIDQQAIYNTEQSVNLVDNSQNASSSGQQIQLKTLTPITPVAQGGTCNHDSLNGLPAQPNIGKPADLTCVCNALLVQCQNRVCENILNHDPPHNPIPGECTNLPPGVGIGVGESWPQIVNGWCGSTYGGNGTDGIYCIGKPVVYLYPLQKTFVSVTVHTPGKIIESDPLYPSGGWKEVIASPDGTLQYNQKNYSELFYESSVTDIAKPNTGITLTTKNLSTELTTLLTKLGLKESEREEFIDFWVPKLQALNTPFIQFSLIDFNEKQRIDDIEISPQPDTRIEFLVYFKPLALPFTGKLLVLPKTPARKGFTEVEWGGTIDTSQTHVLFY